MKEQKTKQTEEIKTQIKQKEREKIEMGVFTLNEIILETNPEETELIKIRFDVNEFEEVITLKTEIKEEKFSMYKGFKTRKEEKRFLKYPDEIPDKILKLNMLLNKLGELKLTTNLQIWNKKDDITGKIIPIRFFYFSYLESMYPVDEEGKEIKL